MGNNADVDGRWVAAGTLGAGGFGRVSLGLKYDEDFQVRDVSEPLRGYIALDVAR